MSPIATHGEYLSALCDLHRSYSLPLPEIVIRLRSFIKVGPFTYIRTWIARLLTCTNKENVKLFAYCVQLN